MKKLFFTAAVLAGVGGMAAQDAGSELFRIFEPLIVDYSRVGFAADGDGAVLTYGSAEENDGVTEYWFGLNHPFTGQDVSYVPVAGVESDDWVELPVTAIGSYAVQNTNIRSFFTGNNIKTIYDYAIHMSKGEKLGACRLTLGRSVERLGHRAIVGEGLAMIVVAADVPPVWTDDESIVLDNAGEAVIVVPDGSLEAYKADARWSGLGEIRTFGEYGLGMYADVDYVTYQAQSPKVWMADGEVYNYMAASDVAGYAICGDEMWLTYSEVLEMDCMYGEPEYYFTATGDFVAPNAISYGDRSYGVKAVGSEAVSTDGYSRLTSFDTGDGVEMLYDNAVYVGNALTSVRLGSSVKVIGDRGVTIESPDMVSRLIVAAQEPPVWTSTQSVLVDNPASVMLIVPDESVEVYRSHRYWSMFTDIHPFSEFGYNGVETVEIAPSESVRYYNLQGMPVDVPTGGVYIKADGNSVTKVMR